MADHLRERATAGEANEKLLPESFALMREAAKRTVGLRHYDVQLIGGMALNDGCVAEMRTGEGKTLVSTAAGFLNALAGDPVHVVTVNDYLAKRDAEWVGRIYRLLGMEVGLIQNGMEPADRRPAYAAAVTYGTNSEFGFDYLRDNMVSTPADRVQRGHAFAVVDEADSVLIDEARTPLIISGLAGAPSEICNNFAEIAAKLDPEEDVVLDEKRRTVYETEAGLAKIEKMLGAEVYADLTGATANRLRQALKAQFLFKLDHDYVVDKGEVKIVDSFTGRIMEGRRYSEGLHQAIEAKEHVEIKPETRTIATVTLQNYFRLYKKLSGMTGTALTAAQQQVESMHFGSRKSVLEYDDVMDLQRKAVYGERNAILDGKDACEGMAGSVESMVDSLLEESCPAEVPSDDWDFGTVDAWVESMTGEEGYDAGEIECDQDPGVLAEDVRRHLTRALDEKRGAVGDPLFGELCAQIALRTMDTHWVAHLADMEGLKAGIGLRAYGHRDPLVEYKEEAYRAFSRLVGSIYEDSLRAVLRLPVDSAGAAPGGLSEEDDPFRPEGMVYSDSRSAPGAPPLDAPDPAGGNPLG